MRGKLIICLGCWWLWLESCIRVVDSHVEYYPTSTFTILLPQNLEIGESNVLRERCATNSKAPKL